MDLKTCRWMTRLLYVGCLALAIIALPLDNQILRMGLLGAALALALMVAMVRDKFWRCPKCRKNLGPLYVKYCPNCGEKLN